MTFKKITMDTPIQKGSLIRKDNDDELLRVVKYLGRGKFHITFANKKNLMISGIILTVHVNDLLTRYEILEP